MAASADSVRAVAHAVRDLVFDVFPDAVEVIWPKQRTVGWGVGPLRALVGAAVEERRRAAAG